MSASVGQDSEHAFFFQSNSKHHLKMASVCSWCSGCSADSPIVSGCAASNLSTIPMLGDEQTGIKRCLSYCCLSEREQMMKDVDDILESHHDFVEHEPCLYTMLLEELTDDVCDPWFISNDGKFYTITDDPTLHIMHGDHAITQSDWSSMFSHSYPLPSPETWCLASVSSDSVSCSLGSKDTSDVCSNSTTQMTVQDDATSRPLKRRRTCTDL